MRHERALQARLECEVTASPGLHPPGLRPGLSERPRWGRQGNGKAGRVDGRTDQARLWWLPSEEEPLPDGRGSACCRRWEPDRFVCEMRHERALQARLECKVTASPGLHPGLSERARQARGRDRGLCGRAGEASPRVGSGKPGIGDRRLQMGEGGRDRGLCGRAGDASPRVKAVADGHGSQIECSSGWASKTDEASTPKSGGDRYVIGGGGDGTEAEGAWERGIYTPVAAGGGRYDKS